jgi:hypothetical protein
VSLRTHQDFSLRIADELGWRRKELVFYKQLVASAQPKTKDSFLRGAVAILYAHWEGFVKAAGELYLEFVTEQRLTNRELADSFLAIAARKWINAAVQSRKAWVHIDLVKLFMTNELDQRAKSLVGSIETRANLTVELFQNICQQLGVPYRPEYQTAEKVIVERLLEVRNSIAHGEYSVVDLPEFEQLYTRIDLMLTLFRNDVENAVLQNHFRRPPAATPITAPAQS